MQSSGGTPLTVLPSFLTSFCKKGWEKAKETCGGVLGTSLGMTAVSAGVVLGVVGTVNNTLGSSSRLACLFLGFAAAGGCALGLISKSEQNMQEERKKQKEGQRLDQAWLDLENAKMVRLLDDIEKRKGINPQQDKEQLQRIQLIAKELRSSQWYLREHGFDLDIWDEDDESWFHQGGVYQYVPPPGENWDPYEYPDVFEDSPHSTTAQHSDTDRRQTPYPIRPPQESCIDRSLSTMSLDGSFQKDFIPGHNAESHMNSLLGMQCALLNTSEQILTTLKLLALKGCEKAFESESILQPEEHFYVKTQRVRGPVKIFKGNNQLVPTGVNFLSPFATINSYEGNLEHKIRSGQVGVMIDVAPGFCCGFAYNRHYNNIKDYSGVQLGTGIGGVKTKSETECLSTVITLNPNKAGFTGQLASSYGWGKVKNTRSFTHANRGVCANGTPNISLTGGLIQLGYNILVSRDVTVTPYIETLYSLVKWSSYKELSGPLPCEVSKNKEQVIEKSIGVRSHWQVTNKSQLQVWVAGISRDCGIDSIRCKPLRSRSSRYEASVPGSRRIYQRTEFGVSYTASLTDKLVLGIHSMIHLESPRKIEGQQMSLALQYVY